jgi:hypothetical protein
MNRRDFLLLRRERDLRIVEVSCRMLYMRYLDARITGAERTESGASPDPWGHEPASVFENRTASQMFDDMAVGLKDADVLRLVDRQWIRDVELEARLDSLIDEFTRRGGRVDFAGSASL